MKIKRKQILKTFSPTNIFLAVAIGVSVSIYNFFSKTQEEGTLSQLVSDISNINLSWVLIALLVLFLRDFGYVYRIRNLTQKELSWSSSIYTTLLWEFASAVTPSVVGGTAVAVFILIKEKIAFGKSLAYVMLTAILDNGYFLLAAPIILNVAHNISFPVLAFNNIDFLFINNLTINLQTIFWVSYILIFAYTLFMLTGVLIAPQSIKWILVKVCSIPFLKKWRSQAIQQGDVMIMASRELKTKDAIYWRKAILSTIVIWSARYLMLNCLIAAFNPNMGAALHLKAYGNQVIMWIAQLLSPTPGSGGFAEIYFNSFFGEFFPTDGLEDTVGFLWRFLTSYLYLIIGALVLRKWIRKVFFGNRKFIKFKN